VAAAVATYAGIGQSIAIAVGAPSWPRVDWSIPPGAAGGIFGAAALIFFAYLGFDELGNLAEEMRRPERDLLKRSSSPWPSARSST
jgi:APA family basic amino acid/polyamine antiporter